LILTLYPAPKLVRVIGMKARFTKLLPFLAAIVIGLIFCLLRTTSLFDKLEWRLFDQWSRICAPHRTFDPEIATLLIDEESMDHFGKTQGWRWPWPREAYAHLLIALKSAGAKEVRFDLLFSENSEDAMQDDRLDFMAQAMGNVSFGSMKGVQTLFSPVFSVELVKELDHIVRRDPMTFQLLVWPGSFESTMKERAFSAWRWVQRGKELEKKYLSKTDLFDVGSLKKGLEQIPFDPELGKILKGKIVFVGGTAAKTYDMVSTPIQPNEPGVFAHVVAFSNRTTGESLKEISWIAQYLPILLLCSLCAFIFQKLDSLTAQTLGGLSMTFIPILFSGAMFYGGWWIPVLTLSMGIFFTSVSLMGYNYVLVGRQREQIKRIFGDFVSPEIIEELMLDPDHVKLGGVKKELSVMFSDLAGFSDFSEKMSAETLVEIMNYYLTEMSEFVIEEGGYLDKYIGDAIMAVFGAPLSFENHAVRACRVALRSRNHLEKINDEVKRRWGFPVFARYGIHSGEMVIGYMGSLRKKNYTVIGDAVNLASRLEGANKPYGTTIMISEATLQGTGSEFLVRPTDLLRVKGKQNAVPVYDLMNFMSEATESEKKIASITRLGFQHYLQQAWDEAERDYREVLEIRPGDSLATLYIERIQEFRKHPPGSEWDGVYVMKTK
jgi:adenylate cyclase